MVFSYLCCCQSFFGFCQKEKVKFTQASNCCKRVLKAAKLVYASKTKESITSKKLGSHDFWRITNSVLNKVKSAILPLLNGPEVLPSASHKANLFAENFSKNSNVDDSGISLPVFPSRTSLQLHNISVSPKMVKKVIMDLDLSKASGPDCIPVVVLKNCESELSYIIAELFNKGLKESFVQIFGRFHQWSLNLRMLGKGLQLKTTALLVFFLSLVKSLKNL